MADEEVRQAEQKKEKKAQTKEESKKDSKKGKGLMAQAKEKIAEAKAGKGAEKPEEAKVVLEREYIVPLRREWLKVPRYKRANKAVKALKEFIAQHMKVYDRDLRKIKIDVLLNNELRFRGIKKPAPKIKVKAVKYDDETVKVSLVEIPKHIEFEIARRARKAAEIEKKAAEKAKPAAEAEKEEPAEEKEESKEDEETKEKEAASKEAMQKLEKQKAKVQKHTATKQKTVTQRKTMQK